MFRKIFVVVLILVGGVLYCFIPLVHAESPVKSVGAKRDARRAPKPQQQPPAEQAALTIDERKAVWLQWRTFQPQANPQAPRNTYEAMVRFVTVYQNAFSGGCMRNPNAEEQREVDAIAPYLQNGQHFNKAQHAAYCADNKFGFHFDAHEEDEWNREMASMFQREL